MSAKTIFLILLSSLVAVSSFTTTPVDSSFRRSSQLSPFIGKHQHQQQQHRVSRPSSWLSGSSRDEEIAMLEAELRRLKQDDAPDAVAAETEPVKKVAEPRNLEKVAGKDMLLSERELVDQQLFIDDGSEAGSENGVLPAVIAAFGAAVFLFFFSQVPVGQDDWSHYSTNSGPTTSTRIDLGDLNSDVGQSK